MCAGATLPRRASHGAGACGEAFHSDWAAGCSAGPGGVQPRRHRAKHCLPALRKTSSAKVQMRHLLSQLFVISCAPERRSTWKDDLMTRGLKSEMWN